MDANEKMLIASAAGIVIGYLIWGRKPPCPCPAPAPAQGVPGMVKSGEACKRC